jgi:biotin-dependent carboxylase-like uncharacterized protein
MAIIKVLEPGFSTAVIDLGRRSFQSSGVPISGPMDMISFRMSNSILNNFEGAAVLECTLLGPTLSFEADTTICVSGAEVQLLHNDLPESTNKAIKIKAGDKFKIGRCTKGMRCYLAIKHGFHSPEYLGSKSFYYPISPKSFLSANDELEYSAHQSNQAKKQARIRSSIFLQKESLWVTKGPEWDLVSKLEHQLINTRLPIGPNNRMGYRIDSDLETESSSMFSSAVIPGTVQLTPSGQLLVATADCQVTGGYPRILVLDEIGLSILAQKRTGQSISLNWKRD